MTTAGAVTLFPVSSLQFQSERAELTRSRSRRESLVHRERWQSHRSWPDVPEWRRDGFPGRCTFRATVANGPNGSLIMTGQTSNGQNEVFSVSTAGAVTRYKIPAAISNAFGTYLGAADGSLWFANESGAPKIGRIKASGVATSYNLSKFVRSRFPFDAMAPDRMVTCTLDNGNTTATVYRLSPSKLHPMRRAGMLHSRR